MHIPVHLRDPDPKLKLVTHKRQSNPSSNSNFQTVSRDCDHELDFYIFNADISLVEYQTFSQGP